MRTIASCASNMNSASARASSVLPTPVGPRKRNVPIGRSGSCRPARERRRALDTASTASSWPMTRSCRRSSMWTSFSTSPSIRRDDRDAGPARDDLGDVLGVDLLLEEAGRLAVGALLGLGELALELGDLAVAQLGRALAGRPRARRARASRCACSRCSLTSRTPPMASFSACHCAFIAVELLAQLGELALERLAALDRRLVASPSPATCARSRAA